MRPRATGHGPQPSPKVRAQRSEDGDVVPSHESRFPIPAIENPIVTIDQLRAWGEKLGRTLRAPAVIALHGELGAGKTTLAQAICRGVGIREDVTSPTFALVNEYEVDGTTVYHLDLYRLNGPEDVTNLGWDDILNSGEIVLIEWPERAGIRLPQDTIRLRLEYIPGDDNHRRLTVA
jgi:tRNA threonylcarbamoyladenosine biosynthesis protein TsaE